MGRNSFSACADFNHRHRAGRPSVSMRCAAGFSLLNFLQENSSVLLVIALAVIAVGILFWLVFHRRHDAFPEIKFRAESRVPQSDVTMIESRTEPEPGGSSGPVPGIYGKIEVRVNGRQINTYLITDNPLTIGRDPAQALAIIQEAIVSKLHCSIFYRDKQVFVKDLNSTNGTYVNEEKVSERELQDNDVIYLGRKGTIRIMYHK